MRRLRSVELHGAGAGRVHVGHGRPDRRPRDGRRETHERSDRLTTSIARHSPGELTRGAGHNCVWHNDIPAWVTNATWTAPELAEVVQEHCFNIIRHWEGQM